MKCAIMQPTFIPWAGYFNLIASVDCFVFLDNVQYERRSWQTRNRILLSGKEHMLSIPVQNCSQKTLLFDVRLSNHNNWLANHWMTIKNSYAKSPFHEEIFHILERFFKSDPPIHLIEFTEAIIVDIVNRLNLSTKIFFSKDLSVLDGTRSERLANICHCLGCDTYISPIGAENYLVDDKFSDFSGINLVFQSFKPSIYPQMNTERFFSHLSIVDVIANIGLESTKKYIQGDFVYEKNIYR